MAATPEEFTILLRAWSDGDSAALDKLVPLVHAELHRLAKHYMGLERAAHTLQATALVNEAYIRLAQTPGMRCQNRSHFFALSAQIMRRILVDFARARRGLKRSRDQPPISLDESVVMAPERSADLLALDEALGRLSVLNARQSRIVELRYFAGLTEQEIADVAGIAPRTVRQDWRMARAWLYRELSRQGNKNDP